MPRVDPESLAKVEEALKLYTAEVERQVGLTSSTKDTYFGRSLLSGWLSISTTTAGAAPPSKSKQAGRSKPSLSLISEKKLPLTLHLPCATIPPEPGVVGRPDGGGRGQRP